MVAAGLFPPRSSRVGRVRTVRVNVRRPTHEHHKRISRNHVVPTLGHLKLEELNAEHVQTLHAAKFDAGYSLAPRRHIHTTLKATLDQAVRFGHLPFNPAAAVKVPKDEAEVLDLEDLSDPDMLPLDGPQVRALFEAAEATCDRFRALCVLGLTTGMRQGEILGLPWRHLDLNDGNVHVLQTLVFYEGGDYDFPPPKTKRSKRTIELRPEAVDALREHRKRQLEERIRYQGLWKEEGLVFPTTTGTPVRRQNLVRRSFKPLLKKAGLPNIRFHDLHHINAAQGRRRQHRLQDARPLLREGHIRHLRTHHARHAKRGPREPRRAFLVSLFHPPCGKGVVHRRSYYERPTHKPGICRTFRSGGTRIRTGDTMIFSHVLYQLSYPAGGETGRDSTAQGSGYQASGRKIPGRTF